MNQQLGALGFPIGVSLWPLNSWLRKTRYDIEKKVAEIDENRVVYSRLYPSNPEPLDAIQAKASQERISTLIELLWENVEGHEQAINRALDQYRVSPVVHVVDGKIYIGHSVDMGAELVGGRQLLRRGIVHPAFTPPQGEVQAVFGILDLAKTGVLSSLRCCSVCRDFFLPSRQKQATCGTACSKRAFASTPRSKEYRRQYQKKYYAKNFKRVIS